MATTDLGAMQKTATLWGPHYAVTESSDVYSLWWFWYPTYTTQNNLLSLNHDTGEVTATVLGPPGRAYAYCQVPSGLIYLGTYAGADNDSPVCSFNVVTGEYTSLHAGPVYDTGDGGPAHDGTRYNCLTYSDEPHQRIFYLGASRAGLWAWDPVDETFQDYGSIDAPEVYRARYGSSLQVSATHAYCPIKDNLTYYLAIVDLSDGSTTTKWKDAPFDTIYVHRGWYGDDEGEIYVQCLDGEVETWYNVTDLDTPISEPNVYPTFKRTYYTRPGYASDGTYATPSGDGTNEIELLYKRPGDSEYRSVFTTLLTAEDYGSGNSGSALDGNIIYYGEAYASITKLITANSPPTKENVGNCGISGYGVGLDYARGLEFLVGYSQQAFQYDPASPFVRGTNPLAITLYRMDGTEGAPDGGGARAYWHAWKMVDNNIWISAEWRRIGYNFQMLWYDPDTPTTGDVGWEALNQHNMETCARNKATTKVLASLVLSGVGTIAVFDVRRKTIQKYITPLGVRSHGRIVSVETSKATTNRFVGVVRLFYLNVTPVAGDMPEIGETMTGADDGYTAYLWAQPASWTVGVPVRCYFYSASATGWAGDGSEDVTFSGGATGTVTTYMSQAWSAYCVDIRTGALIWGPTDYVLAPATFGAYNAGLKGPVFAHGYVWFCSQNYIYKLDPSDGTGASTGVEFTAPGDINWSADGEYMFYSSASTKHVYQIPKADLGL